MTAYSGPPADLRLGVAIHLAMAVVHVLKPRHHLVVPKGSVGTSYVTALVLTYYGVDSWCDICMRAGCCNDGSNKRESSHCCNQHLVRRQQAAGSMQHGRALGLNQQPSCEFSALHRGVKYVKDTYPRQARLSQQLPPVLDECCRRACSPWPQQVSNLIV
jgi:hypothetical protein